MTEQMDRIDMVMGSNAYQSKVRRKGRHAALFRKDESIGYIGRYSAPRHRKEETEVSRQN